MTYEQRNCREFLNRNSNRFGITAPNIFGEYLEICARNVRCVASRAIDEKLVLPSMSSFINSCTGLVDSAGGIDTQFASIRVTHAAEEPVDCDTNCPGIKVIIKGQIIVRTKSCHSCCAPSYMAIPVEFCSQVIRDFYYAASGDPVTQLKNELPNIDGSCMVINLNCKVYREICGGGSRYVAHITGSVVDKLWKTENIWIEGIRPYRYPSITVCDKFDKDICTCLSGSEYFSVNSCDLKANDQMCHETVKDNSCGCHSCGTPKDCAATHKNNCDCGCDDGCECASVCK